MLPPELDALVERLDAVWHLLPYDARWQAARDQREARRRSSASWTWHAAHGRDCVDAEVEFEVALGADIVLRGFADRLELDDLGRLVVVDLKTGKSSPTEENLRRDPQLGVYQLAVREGAFPDRSTTPGGAELVQLRGRAAGRPRCSSRPRSRRTTLGRRSGRPASRRRSAPRRFRPGRTEDCDRCRFRTSCPSGDQGGQVII